MTSGDTVRRPALLTTKLHAPRRRRGAIVRWRLTARLSIGDLPRLVLVSAPAGFGKSTLLADWLADDGTGSVAWLSLDGRDNDPTTFWNYVVAALRTAAPHVGAAALEVLDDQPTDPIAVVAALVADLATLDRPLVLVLDDYHVIDAPELHESVAYLVDHLPAGAAIALSTRMDPPLPLGRLRASGDLVERRAADLRFTADEAADYLNGTMGLDLTADDVEALDTRTEGWIAALQLAALSMQGRDDVTAFIDSFAGDDRFVVDYLVEEVLDRQPPDVRRFLLETSLLGRLTGALCDAVLGGTSGRATLERLDRSNLFLVPLDDRRLWYRYHHLFGDVLRARLLDESPKRVPELHRRAAAWLAENDDPVEAIDHALSGEDFERAAELIELTAPGLHRVRQEAQVRHWLEALPDHLFLSRPVLSITLVGARMSTGDPTGVDALLTGVEAWLDDDSPPDVAPIVVDVGMYERLPAQVAVYRAALALLSGDLAGTISNAERALGAAGPDDHLRRGSATALMGLARWASGDLVAARVAYTAAIDHLIGAEHFADALGCLLALGDMCRAQGQLDDAIAALHEGLELVRSHPGLRGAADMHAALCELHLERNELDLAREHLAVSDALGERAGLPQHPYRSRVAAACLAEAEGDPATALALLDEAERRYDTDFSPSVRPIPAMKARTLLRRGDIDGAARWAERRGLTADDEVGYVSEYDHLTLARTLVATHVRDRADTGALQLLARLRSSAVEGGRAGAVIETDVLEAITHHALGDRPAALAALERALVGAEPERQLRVFLDQGPALVALLRTATFETPAAASHCRRVLAASAGVVAPPPTAGLVDELSSRELDVLRLLRSELNGPEIARELIVSLNTMRTHTKNIYAKLGVTNRREAVRRADELGL